jgi:hypothetical protein
MKLIKFIDFNTLDALNSLGFNVKYKEVYLSIKVEQEIPRIYFLFYRPKVYKVLLPNGELFGTFRKNIEVKEL